MSENSALRDILGPKRDEVTRQWKLHDLHSSTNIIREIRSRMRWAKHVARMGERRGAYRACVVKPKGKRPLE